jgi:hypothetical protein
MGHCHNSSSTRRFAKLILQVFGGQDLDGVLQNAELYSTAALPRTMAATCQFL